MWFGHDISLDTMWLWKKCSLDTVSLDTMWVFIQYFVYNVRHYVNFSSYVWISRGLEHHVGLGTVWVWRAWTFWQYVPWNTILTLCVCGKICLFGHYMGWIILRRSGHHVGRDCRIELHEALHSVWTLCGFVYWVWTLCGFGHSGDLNTVWCLDKVMANLKHPVCTLPPSFWALTPDLLPLAPSA